MAKCAAETYKLSQILGNRRWLEGQRPFPHIVATDVFEPCFYKALEGDFNGILDRSFGSSNGGFSQKFAHYDAYAYALRPEITSPLSIFASVEWCRMLAAVTNVQATAHVNVALHHHSAGSCSGRVHNDLNPGWFYDYSASVASLRTILPRHELCSYRHGTGLGARSQKREVVRAATLLFYLCNGQWRRGDGGETGLYWEKGDALEEPAIAIAPLNNSLVTFECTPHSYHSFLTNKRTPRNAVIMWLHCEKDHVAARWGEDSIVYWPSAEHSEHGGL
jgi:hypothetical protein